MNGPRLLGTGSGIKNEVLSDQCGPVDEFSDAIACIKDGFEGQRISDFN